MLEQRMADVIIRRRRANQGYLKACSDHPQVFGSAKNNPTKICSPRNNFVTTCPDHRSELSARNPPFYEISPIIWGQVIVYDSLGPSAETNLIATMSRPEDTL